MTLTLNPEHQKIVESMMRSGHFRSADEVVAQALALLSEREAEEKEKLEWLRREVMKGVEQADRGECTPWDVNEFLAEAHAEYEKRHGRKP